MMENDELSRISYQDRTHEALDYYFKTMELDSDYEDILFKSSERFKVRPIDVHILLLGFGDYEVNGIKLPRINGIFRYY